MPVPPYLSLREPTRIVRFTVVVGFEPSGNVSTCRPFGSAYSVMPSTVVTRARPGGRRTAALSAAVWASATWAQAPDAHKATSHRARPRIAGTNRMRAIAPINDAECKKTPCEGAKAAGPIAAGVRHADATAARRRCCETIA